MSHPSWQGGLCEDFSTILAIKADERNAILADLRRIYDGELKKEFGTSEAVPKWQGRITLVAAVTEMIDRYYTVIQALGDRFVMVRWERSGQEAAIRAMTQDTVQARSDLRQAVHALFGSLRHFEPGVDVGLLARLAALAEFAVRARSYVPRDRDKSVIGEPQAESAPRLAQQLCQLARGSARLSHRDVVVEEDFAVARRAAFDCVPGRRRAVLDRAIDGGKVIANTSTQSYDRYDLRVLGLVKDDRLSPRAIRLLEQIDEKPFTQSPP